jgi:HEAT repeat protein
MRTRLRVIGILLVVTAAVIAVVLAFPATLYVPLGWLKGEAFFEGKPTSYWARALKREPYLGEAPPAGDIGMTLRKGGTAAVAVLRALAESPDDNIRSEALLALSLMGSESKGATPELAATVKKEMNSTRFLLASQAYGNADPGAAATALGDVARAKAEDRGRRAFALTALLALAPNGQEALPALYEMLRNPEEDSPLRVEAGHVLWRMKQSAESLIPILCQILTAEKSSAGVQALELLGEMGPAAKSAVPTLCQLLKKPGLEPTGNRWGPPHLAAVIRTTGQIGPEAAVAVPLLIALLRDNYYIRTEVAIALANIGPSAQQALAARDGVWESSITLLAARPPANLATLPLIEIMARTWVPRNEQDRIKVRDALLRVDPTASERLSSR